MRSLPSGLWMAWAEDINCRRGRDGVSLVGDWRLLVVSIGRIEIGAMHAQTVVGSEATKGQTPAS